MADGDGEAGMGVVEAGGGGVTVRTSSDGLTWLPLVCPCFVPEFPGAGNPSRGLVPRRSLANLSDTEAFWEREPSPAPARGPGTLTADETSKS